MKDAIQITIVSSPAVPRDRAYLANQGCANCGGRMAWTVASRLECPACGHHGSVEEIVAVRGIRAIQTR